MNYKTQLMWLIFSVPMIYSYHASVVVDDDPLLQPNSYHLIGLEQDTFLVHMLLNENHQCSYRIYNFLSTLSVSGVYRLANSVTGTITITANDVMLDLYGNTLTGALVVQSGVKNVTIKRGIINATSTDGIQVNTGCSAISIYDISVQNATNGIHLIQTTDSVIERCTMVANATGMFIDTASNLVIKNCNALRNLQTGFSLNLSTTCALLDCEALSTGDGNTQVINNNVYGFVSQNGFGNIFDRCTANGTQALTTTDFSSVVAGFALTGTEQFSRITNSTVSGTATASKGVTVPYGIWLQATVNPAMTATAVPAVPVASDLNAGAVWSPDGIYIAAGGASPNTIQIFKFDTVNLILSQVTEVFPPGNTLLGVSWSNMNDYIIGGTQSSTLLLYKFDRINNSLTLLQTITLPTPPDRSPVWRFDDRYLLVCLTDFFYIFSVNKISNAPLSLVSTTASPSGLTPAGSFAAAWSPDGNFMAVGYNPNTLIVYSFVNNTVTQVASINPNAAIKNAVAWSPDGALIASGDTTGNKIYVYSFNPQTYALNMLTSITAVGGGSVWWSSDGRYLSSQSPNLPITVYYYDRGANTLTVVSKGPTIDTASRYTAPFSPDGRYILEGLPAAGPTASLTLYQILSFPSNNVIKNNTISCCTGAQYPSGVGIYGSSIANLIIQNTAYASPRNPTYVFTNYQFVCNVFSQLTGMAPTYLQNTEVNNLVLQAADLDTTLKIIESKLAIVQQQVTALIPFS